MMVRSDTDRPDILAALSAVSAFSALSVFSVLSVLSVLSALPTGIPPAPLNAERQRPSTCPVSRTPK